MKVTQTEITQIYPEKHPIAGRARVVVTGKDSTLHLTVIIQKNRNGELFPFLPSVGQEAAVTLAKPVWWDMVNSVRAAFHAARRTQPRDVLLARIETAKEHAKFYRSFILPNMSAKDSAEEASQADSTAQHLETLLADVS